LGQKKCEKDFKMTPVITDAAAAEAYWDAEYAFFHKIISEEVNRQRLSRGLEEIECTLYPVKNKSDRSAPDYVGQSSIGHSVYMVVAHRYIDSTGQEVINVKMTAKP